jgi:hypothetical protein
MKTRWSATPYAVLALFLGAGCDALSVRPGHDFGVAILNEQPIQAVGLVTVPLRVAVTGCDAVQAEVDGAAGRHAVDLIRQPNGTWTSAVPVEWLRGDDGTCDFDGAAPQASTSSLVVTCLDAGRSIATDVAVSYGTAIEVLDLGMSLGRQSVEAICPSLAPLRPFTLAPSGLQNVADLDPVLSGIAFDLDGSAYTANPLVRTRMVHGSGQLFLTVGCPTAAGCPPVPFPGSDGLESTQLTGFEISEAGTWSSRRVPRVFVPANVIDLGFAADGALLVLSQGRDANFGKDAAIVTRVVVSADWKAVDVSVIGYYPREWVESRLATRADGTLAFLTYELPAPEGPMRSVLYVVDGGAITRTMDPTSDLWVGRVYHGSYSHTLVQLSPDGTSIVVAGLYEGPPGGPFAALPAVDEYWLDDDRGGVVWLDGALGLWRGQSLLWGSSGLDGTSLEVFDPAPPHARRFGYQVDPLPGASGTVVLYGATAVGDKLALTTSTGLRVLGPDGALIGGADPLPCRLSPTTVAVRTGPTQVAVGAGRYLYVFDLAGLGN